MSVKWTLIKSLACQLGDAENVKLYCTCLYTEVFNSNKYQILKVILVLDNTKISSLLILNE